MDTPKHSKVIKGPETTGGELAMSGRLVARKLPRLQAPGTLEVNTGDDIAVSEKVVGHGQGTHVEAIRVADSQAQSTAADLFADGTVTFTIQGRSRQGEEGNDQIAKTLIQRLNRDGGRWGPPKSVKRGGGDDFDFEITDGEKCLGIQITRAEPSPTLWEGLNVKGRARHEYRSPDGAAEVLRRVIEKKAKKYRQESRRAQMILALDATETAAQVFASVITAFRNRHGQWARQLSFREIWLVGPTNDLSFRLDSEVP